MSDSNWKKGLREIVGAGQLLEDPILLDSYGTDGYTLEKARPSAVVLPADREQLHAVVSHLYRERVPYVARGAGTSLSGGAIPLDGAVVVHLSRMHQIRSIDWYNRVAYCEPGVVNRKLSEALAPFGYYYAPDPSSQQACTLGGNVAENSGGPHCLKFGVTLNHIKQLEVVWPNGDVELLGSLADFAESVDVKSLMVGSEGMLGIVSGIWARIVELPQSRATTMVLFDDVQEASQAVSAIIAAGVIPAALELMDPLAIEAVERGVYRVGYPPGVAAVLLVEVDGPAPEVKEEQSLITHLLGKFPTRDIRIARSAAERELWWANRKTAFGAMGLLAPRYYVQDGVIPRSQLPSALRKIGEIGEHYDIRIANVFHAGDGNLHPLLLYDDKDAHMVQRVRQAGSEILRMCLALGGSITGEHGVGLEKMEELTWQMSPAVIQAQWALKNACDPEGLANPKKVLPVGSTCLAELSSDVTRVK
ncbi:MAG: FAD-binding protein [Firmicutes bacterium]|jgi:glycolate oxidase|nr:FAD-binding protein [Bacillota bacterium]